MEDSSATHPSAEILQAYSMGQLDDVSAKAVVGHLQTCADCRQAVAALTGDIILAPSREGHGQGDTPAPGKALEVIARTLKPAVTLPNSPAVLGIPPELANYPQYEVVRELGRGGMGVVYLARHRLSGREEVLKVMNREWLAHSESKRRFLREIKAAAMLDHPNVVKMYTAMELGDLMVLVMEYAGPESLADVLKARGRPLPVAVACYYIQQAALGLQHAFEKQMVHRDIKPQNLMLSRDSHKHIVKILDFGLAKVLRENQTDAGLTREGMMIGTPTYIAPEQIQHAAQADIRADIYSLGCTLYHLLSGRPPFEEPSHIEMLQAQRSKTAQPLNLVRPEVPAELAVVVRKMLAKDPAKRYQTPIEVAQALAPFIKPRQQDSQSKPRDDRPVGEGGTKPLVPQHQRIVRAESLEPLSRGTEARERPAVSDSLRQTGGASSQFPKRAVPRKRRLPARQPVAGQKWLIGIGAATGVLLSGLLILWVAGVFKSKTKEGILAVETNDSNPKPVSGLKPAIGDARPVGALTPADPKFRRAYKNRNGDWKIESGELVQASRLRDCQLVFGDFAWKDYDFTCEAKKLNGGCRESWRDDLSNWAGGGRAYVIADVAFLYHVNGAGLGKFSIGGGNNTVDFAALTEHGSYAESKPRAGGWENNRWYKLTVRLRGSHCQCFRDDQLVFEFEDRENPKGAVGLMTWTTAVRFRNIRVTDPGENLLLDGLPALPAAAGQWPPATEPKSEAELHCLTAHGAPVTCVTFSRDGRQLLSGSDGGTSYADADGKMCYDVSPPSTLRLWDSETGRELDCAPLVEPVSDNRGFVRLALAPAAGQVLSIQQPPGKTVLWEISGGKLKLRNGFTDDTRGVIDLTVVPGGQRAVALGETGNLWEWDISVSRPARLIPGAFSVAPCGAISPAGEFALLAQPDEPFVELNLVAGKETVSWKRGLTGVRSLAISADGRRVVSGHDDGKVVLWDATTRQHLHSFKGHQFPVRAVAISPDGRRAISGGRDQTVRLWDLDERRELACFAGHTNEVRAVAFSPDGLRAASGGMDYTVRLWRLP
jgi:serine/threonine protein kinase/WD40 repeat protein